MSESNSRTRVHYVHRLNYSVRERLVGVFVLLALAIILALIFAKGRASYLFEDKITYHAYLKNAQGISTESLVKVSGLQVGRVSSLDLSPDNRIHVTLFVYERFADLVRTDSRGELSKLSFIGDAAIEITAGSPLQARLLDGATIEIDEPMSIDELIAELTPVMEKVRETVDRVALIVAAIDPQAVKNSSDALSSSLVNIQAISDQVAQGEGALGMMVRDQKFKQDMLNSVASLEATLQQAGQRVVEMKPVLGNVHALTGDTRKVVADMGKVIAQTDELVKQMNSAMRGINVDLQQVPELIGRMQLLLDSTDRTLEGIQRIYPISAAVDESGRARTIEVRPNSE